jgi:F-type H+-transporting ATPase subunit b
MLARLSVKTLLLPILLILLPGVSKAEAEKEGMPQLDPHSYASQLFWLSVFFILVFLFLRYVGLPRLTAIIDARATAIDSDIAAASLLRAQADEAEKAYAATMASAHGEARKLLADTHERNVAALAEQTKQAVADAEIQVGKAVHRIDAARAEALTGLRDVARDLAAGITVKLAGHAPTAARLNRAIDEAAGEAA